MILTSGYNDIIIHRYNIAYFYYSSNNQWVEKSYQHSSIVVLSDENMKIVSDISQTSDDRRPTTDDRESSD